MRARLSLAGRLLVQGSLIALTAALASGASAADSAAKPGAEVSEVVVTGSLIQRAGFEAPTPTTVVSAVDLRLADRPSIAAVLNDLPQFRASSTPATTVAAIANSVAGADLRGLGGARTLTLLDGQRFIGAGDLNSVPQGIVKAVDIVTGGASAAWGSGAVSGVVNIILDDNFTGLTVGADVGESTHDDAKRYSYNGTFGTNFLDGRGHFMVAGNFYRDEGAFGRASRPNTLAAVFQDSTGQLSLQTPVHFTNLTGGGIIVGGKANQLSFNPDGSLSPLVLGSLTSGNFTVGGNGQNTLDGIAITTPYKRANVFSRASLDLDDNTKVWADFNFSELWGNYTFVPATQAFAVQADNAFLTPGARAQLTALGATFPLTVGKILFDVGPTGTTGLKTDRQTEDVAVGIDGMVKLGVDWTYSARAGYGESRGDQHFYNQQIKANFANAVDAIAGPGGTPICRANAVTITAPGCVPLNLLGTGHISAAAIAYAFGSAQQISVNKLDTAGLVVRGTPFSSWAGPVDLVFGAEYRKESTSVTADPLSQATAFTSLNYANLAGAISVKEGFGEINVPVLDVPDMLHVELNGAARYSDYSTSGGIWSWKYGATARIAHDLLLRGTYSRDIRSPGVGDLFSVRGTSITNAQDPYRGVTQGGIVNFTGGNPNLVPEIAHTLTLGGSYSPSYISGLSLSVDYYDIDIADAIASLSLQDTLNTCFKISPSDPTCGGIISRNPDGTIAFALRTSRNLADYRTKGVDLEASYVMPIDRLVSGWDGNLRFRYLGNYTKDLLINTGVTLTNYAGVVGDSNSFSAPKWRQTFSVTYDNKDLSLDGRVRYVGGGIFSRQLGPNGKPISNNEIDAKVYTDIGAQYRIHDATLSVSIANLFDTKPPFVTLTTPLYDVIGRYYSASVKYKFW